MKLRIQGNSVRFRLLQGEVAQLLKQGRLEQAVEFAQNQKLIYALELSPTLSALAAEYKDHRILIKIPAATVKQWAQTNQVSIKSRQPVGGEFLEVLIEKDFKCLDSDRPENADAFPNPKEGKGCE